MGTVHSMDAKRDNARTPPPGGEEPPMDLSERVAKIEAVIPTLSTREDLVRESGLLRTDLERGISGLRTDMGREISGLRTEMHKEFTAQTWRIIGAMITFGSLLTAAVYFVARNVH